MQCLSLVFSESISACAGETRDDRSLFLGTKKIYISEIAEHDHYEPWHRSPLSRGSRDVINTVEIDIV